jgi:hypothetical protein
MKRPLKIALVGAEGYQTQPPERIDCFSWENLPRSLNLRDYDRVILNVLSHAAAAKVDWQFFETALNVRVTSELLQSEGSIIVIGDPRFSIPVPTKDKLGKSRTERPFLFWSGVTFDWDDQPGDTVIISEKDEHRQFQEYLKNLRRWDYSLRSCKLDRGAFEHVQDVRTLEGAGLAFVLQEQTVCCNRYQHALAFIINFAIQRPADRYESRPHTLFAFGPIVFIPRADLDEDQTIVTVLRDLCGVESASPEPAWVSGMIAPGQGPIDKEIGEITSRMESLRQDLARAHGKRDEVRIPLRLLYERGAALEKAVREVMRSLGADVEDPTEAGKEDGWVTVQASGKTYHGALEVKSTRNDQFGEDGIRQLLDWVNRGVHLRQKRYKGIFVGNSAVEKHVNQRPWPFSDNWKKSAEVGQLAALRSSDLLLLYCLAASRKLNRDEFWDQLFNTNGVFDMRPYQDALIPKDKGSET